MANFPKIGFVNSYFDSFLMIGDAWKNRDLKYKIQNVTL